MSLGITINKKKLKKPDNIEVLSSIEKQEHYIRQLRRRGRDAYKLRLTHKIIFDDSYTDVIIEGERRIGKTVYALMVMYEIYQDWDEVFKNIAFSLHDFINLLQEIRRDGLRRPCVLFDDAGVSAGAAVYNLDQELYNYFKGLMDTVGTITKAVICTSPDSNLIKPLRGGNRFLLRVQKGRHRYDRIIRGYKRGRSPLDQQYCSLLFEDNIDVRIPVYERYFKLREKLSFKALDTLDSYLSEAKKGNPEIPKKDGNMMSYNEYTALKMREQRAKKKAKQVAILSQDTGVWVEPERKEVMAETGH